MSEETADQYTGMKGDDLRKALRDRGLKSSGSNTVMADRLREDDAAPEELKKEQLIARAEALGIQDFPKSGNRDAMIDSINAFTDGETQSAPAGSTEGAEPVDEETAAGTGNVEARGTQHLPEQADLSPAASSTHVGIITEPLGPDGQPLPQLHPEPADVAGPGGFSEGELSDPDNRQRAWVAAERSEAIARNGGTAEQMTMGQVDASPSNPDFDPDERPEEGFHEHTLPTNDRREAQLAEWAEQNPHATIIPPALLPAAYQDPTIATPGLPGESL